MDVDVQGLEGDGFGAIREADARLREMERHVSAGREDLANSTKRLIESSLRIATESARDLDSVARGQPPRERRQTRSIAKDLKDRVAIATKRLKRVVQAGERNQLLFHDQALRGAGGELR